MRFALKLLTLAACGLAVSCGGSDPAGPTGPTGATAGNPTPTPTQPPAGTATPRPTEAPDPREGLPEGPIVTMTVKLRPVDRCRLCGEFRSASQENGRWVLYTGEWVVFDSDQRNEKGDKCRWVSFPEWDLDDPHDVLYVRGSSEPFLLKAEVVKEGIVPVWATIDGVKSNVLVVDVRKGPRPKDLE